MIGLKSTIYTDEGTALTEFAFSAGKKINNDNSKINSQF